MEESSFWLQALEDFATGDEVDLPSYVELEVLQSRTDAVTAEAVQASAVAFMPLDRFILVALYPEAYGQ